jgi:hypothetical protein
LRGVGSHDFETTHASTEALGQPKIVEDSAKEEEFFIEFDAFRPRGQSPKNKGSENVLIN